MGKIVVQSEDKDSTFKLVDAIHTPIISEELFYAVQDKLNESINRRKAHKNKKMRPELPLRGIMLCSKCDNLLTGSASKSKTGTYHFYYHCNKCHNERIPAAKLNNEVESIVGLFQFNSNVQELYKKILNQYMNEEEKSSVDIIKKAQKDFELLEKRLENLQFLMLDGNIDISEYQTLKSKLVTEISNVKRILAPEKSNGKELKESLKQSMNMLTSLPKAMKSMDVEDKHAVLSSIFPSKLKYDGNNCRTPKMNQVLELILNVDKGSMSKIKRDKLQNLGLSLEVVSEGIEPSFSV